MDSAITRDASGSSPRVSAIVPVKNRADLLPRAVHSVLNQSHTMLEAIVVDDDSTDDTWMVATSLAAEDPRVVPLRNTGRRGAQGARNTGIRAARGEWISFLDSDDYWLPNSVQVRIAAATADRVEVAHSDCLVHRTGQSTVRWRLPALDGNVLQALLGAPGPVYPGLLVTRHALEAIGLLDETIVAYQEWDTAILLAEQFEFAFVDAPTFVWDCTHSGTISGDPTRNAAGYAQVVTKHRQQIDSVLGNEGLADHYVLLARMFSSAESLDGVLWSMRRLARCDSGWRHVPAAVSCAARPWRDRLVQHVSRRVGLRGRHRRSAPADT
jgi:glycosyltransferase involved in cell wall biosynthesis